MDDRELRASLLHLPDARPGADFTAQVLARVERRERSRRSGHAGVAARGGWPLPGRRGTLVAAGLAAAVVAAVGLWRPGGEWWAGAAPEAASADGGERRDERGRQGRRPAVAEPAGAKTSPGGGENDEPEGRRAAGSGAPAAAPPAERSRGDRRGASSGSAGDAAPAPDVEAPAAAGHAATAADRKGGDRVAALAGIPAAAAVGAPSTAVPPSTPFVERGSDAPGTALDRAADFFAAPPAAAHPPDPTAALLAERLARLAAERERLAARLAEFRRELPPAEPPVVLLGADEGLELVFDVGRFAAGRPPAAEVRPAVHSTTGPPRR